MPFSFDFFNKDVKEFINNLPKTDRILDIGPGAGKYGKMLKREGRRVEALEVFQFYIDHFKLNSIYDAVHVGNAAHFRPNFKEYDLVIMGDVLEHLTVEEAQGLSVHLEQMQIPMLVLIPYCFAQGASYGNDHEEHKQADLTESVFHERYPGFKLIFGNDSQGVFYRG